MLRMGRWEKQKRWLKIQSKSGIWGNYGKLTSDFNGKKFKAA